VEPPLPYAARGSLLRCVALLCLTSTCIAPPLHRANLAAAIARHTHIAARATAAPLSFKSPKEKPFPVAFRRRQRVLATLRLDGIKKAANVNSTRALQPAVGTKNAKQRAGTARLQHARAAQNKTKNRFGSCGMGRQAQRRGRQGGSGHARASRHTHNNLRAAAHSVQYCKLNTAQRFNATARAADNEVFDPSERAPANRCAVDSNYAWPCSLLSPALRLSLACRYLSPRCPLMSQPPSFLIYIALTA